MNVPDPSVLNAPELYSIPFAAKGVYENKTVSYSKSELARVVKDYKVALTPSIAALFWRGAYGWYSYGYDWDFWAPSMRFTITAPKRLVEYLSPWPQNISLWYPVGYEKKRDQPNVATPYFLYVGWEHYPVAGDYSIATNRHPLAPEISIDVYGSNVATLDAWTDIFQDFHVYKIDSSVIFDWDTLWWEYGILTIKRNGTVIFNGSFYGWQWVNLNNLPLPAKFEFDLYGQSNLGLSSNAFTKIEFEVPVNGSYYTWDPIWCIFVNGLDLNNTHIGGNITGYIITNMNLQQTPSVTSVEYSVDDGATWKLAQINSVAPYNFSFFLSNVPGGSYVSLRINLTNPKMSYTVLRGFYVKTVYSISTVDHVCRDMVSALQGDVYFILPDIVNQPFRASATDWAAQGAIYGITENQQNLGMDDWDSLVDNTNGRPVIQSGKTIVTIGSAFVNFVVRYYENRDRSNFWKSGNTPVQDQSYIRMNLDGTSDLSHIWFETTNRSSTPGMIVASLTLGDLRSGTKDMFVVQSFTDQGNRKILEVYGLGWKGSWIGSIWLKEQKASNFNMLMSHHWFIIKWDDANNDKLPQLEELTLIASGD
jgi:hypothetical protein